MTAIYDLILEYGDEYLICSGDMPCIGTGRIADESVFYHLDPTQEATVFERFNVITGKMVDRETTINNLSGGQKVILMLLLALYSPAPRILLHNVRHNLDPAKRLIIDRLIGEYAQLKTIRDFTSC